MLLLPFLLMSFVSLFVVAFWRLNFKPGTPPGPLNFPLVGSVHLYLLFIKKIDCCWEIWTTLSRKYGRVFHLKMGVVNAYAITDLELAKKALASNDWIDRPLNPCIDTIYLGNPKGVLFGKGAEWREIRRYTFTTLKKFGFGKTASMDSIVSKQAEELNFEISDRMYKSHSADICFKTFFAIASLNVTWSLMGGHPFDRYDEKARELVTAIRKFSSLTSFAANPIMVFPSLKRVVPGREREIRKQFFAITGFIQSILEEKRQKASFESDQLDFFDMFLKSIVDAEKIGASPNYYTEWQLVNTAIDLIFGGAETSSSSMEFAVLAMSKFPEVQQRIHDEVVNVVGTDRVPTFSDASKMPYSYAAVFETLRMANSLPFNGRSNLRGGARIGDLVVPKGSLLLINTFGYHMDPEVWDQPEEFRPSRFLDAENRVINTDKLMAFGYGKRVCPGDSVGKANIFTFLTSLVQSFKFETLPGGDLSEVWMRFDDGFTISPKKYFVRVIQRQRNRQ